jgi:hypothetical protein
LDPEEMNADPQPCLEGISFKDSKAAILTLKMLTGSRL